MTDNGLPRRRRWRRARIALLVLIALGALLGLAAWIARVPLATRLVDRRLAEAHVPARYRIADLGFGRQRLEDVVLGDPAHPDLVADWIETVTDVTLAGPTLTGVRVGRVRLRGRVMDGKLSLGSIDRLLPKGPGGALRLPALDVAAEDARMRLETPWGVAGLALSGQGRLDGGFRGSLAVASARMAQAGCTAAGVGGVLSVATAGGSGPQSIRLDGPLQVARLSCSGATLADVRTQLNATAHLGGAPGSTLTADLTTGAATLPSAKAAALAGRFSLTDRGAGALAGTVALSARAVRADRLAARQLALDGQITRTPAALGYTGTVRLTDADARALAPRLAGAAPGTPVAPLFTALDTALTRAAHRLSATAQVTAQRSADGTTRVRFDHADLSAASGARATLTTADDDALTWSSRGGVAGGATLALAGGGLPRLDATAATRKGTLTGTARIAPFAANGAALALAPVRFTIGNGIARILTTAQVSGPLAADGRVDRLTIPLDLRLDRGAVTLGPGCTPLAFDRLALSGLVLRPARLTLCPTDGALLRYANGRLQGGARIAAPRLSGRIGTTPLALATTRAELRLDGGDLSLAGLAATIGGAGRETRLAVDRLDGRIAAADIAGTFAGASGQVANVPLLLSQGAGRWRFAHGRLDLTGALGVTDANTAAPRFKPMTAQDVTFSLAQNVIRAAGVLHEPTTGTKVADVTIVHRLSPGTGEADIAIPALTFAKGFQPDLITPLTFGVIADVNATVRGDGHIAWGPDGVTSTGTFSTRNAALAAAFGPVEGLSSTIRFTDLLNFQSAPHQEVTLASVNPGVAVTDGRILYQTLPGARVQIEGGRWPFAGGTLTLEPTLLDLGSGAEKRMTFRLDGVEADQFLERFDFKNLDVSGTFDGALPMIFDASGGRIEGGRLKARTGGGRLAYVGPVSEKDLGFWANFAFQALKSLTYRDLDITMNGPLAGDMVTQVRFAGIKQGEGAKSNFLIRRLTRLPIVFNITIKAPFRSLIDSATSFWDPSRLVQRNLPALIAEEKKRAADAARTPPAATPPIQPSASETVP